jgi:hypothetical protein
MTDDALESLLGELRTLADHWDRCGLETVPGGSLVDRAFVSGQGAALVRCSLELRGLLTRLEDLTPKEP